MRDEQLVRVGETTELWRLVWTTPPKPACALDDDLGGMWATCACAGFEHGERGDLLLRRFRDGQLAEALPITQFFNVGIVDWGRSAIVPRWPVHDSDWETGPPQRDALIAAVRGRPTLKIMRLLDYNHDGDDTEFYLQVGTEPCGKRMGIVIGVTRSRPCLHAFGSAERSDTPLILRSDHWEALANADGAISGIDWECGDHGSDTQDVVELRIDTKGIHVEQRSYACKDDGTRGALLKSEPR